MGVILTEFHALERQIRQGDDEGALSTAQSLLANPLVRQEQRVLAHLAACEASSYANRIEQAAFHLRSAHEVVVKSGLYGHRFVSGVGNFGNAIFARLDNETALSLLDEALQYAQTYLNDDIDEEAWCQFHTLDATVAMLQQDRERAVAALASLRRRPISNAHNPVLVAVWEDRLAYVRQWMRGR